MMRIAFVFGNISAWTGGISFYKNLLAAISLAGESKRHTLLAILPGSSSNFTNLSRQFDEVHVFSPTGIEKVVRHAAVLLSERENTAWLSPETPLSRLLRRLRVQVAFLKENPLPNFRVPAICWFPDFQYLHLPEMFSVEEAEVYAHAASDMARFATRLMLTSKTVQKDFASLFPAYTYKTRVIPFAAWVDESIYQDDPEQVAREYHLPTKFFYLPNQFWKHKNHCLVLEALSLLKQEGKTITVVASGLMEDYRNPSYPSELVSEIARRGLRDQFVLLGMIPRRHVYGLMRQSLGVLQPSLFEGWNTSVEEAKSLGKPVLASDLEVHREQDAPGAVYFDPHNARQLAECLKTLEKEWLPGPDLQAESRARQWMLARAQAAGKAFLDLAAEIA